MGEPTARIGIFGGTFDPIHTGHLEVADAVRKALGLDRMLLMVAHQPWQKRDDRVLTPAEDRFAMVEAAAAGWPGLDPCRMEIDRGGPTYSIDTVRQLHRDVPDAELILVVGSDVVAGLTTWKDELTLRDLVTLAVVGRPGARRSPLRRGGGRSTWPSDHSTSRAPNCGSGSRPDCRWTDRCRTR